MLTKAGIFNSEESFCISGKGIVIAGYANDFIPKIGMFISITINSETKAFKIIGIELEFGKIPKAGSRQFGLLLQMAEELTKLISENKVKDQNAEVFRQD